MKKLLLLYVSRSFSTLLMRLMMNAGARVYHDRLGGAIRFPTEEFTPEKVTDFYLAEAAANAAGDRHTFIKESCWVFEEHERCLQRLVQEGGFTPVYLVRAPKDALLSYLKMEQQAGDKEKWSAARSIRHDLLHRLHQGYGGPIIIAEDLVSAPEPITRALFQLLDLPFDPGILTLQPLPVDVLAESRILKNYHQFYEATLKSDRIIDRTVGRGEVEITDPELRAVVDRNEVYYQRFLADERRLRAGPRGD